MIVSKNDFPGKITVMKFFPQNIIIIGVYFSLKKNTGIVSTLIEDLLHKMIKLDLFNECNFLSTRTLNIVIALSSKFLINNTRRANVYTIDSPIEAALLILDSP